MKPRIKFGRAGSITVIDRGAGTARVDSVALHTLEQAVRFYGIRNVLTALAAITDAKAAADVALFNTVQAKQWAAWSVALEALRDDRKLTDPGRA